jgi:hypothetical protein
MLQSLPFSTSLPKKNRNQKTSFARDHKFEVMNRLLLGLAIDLCNVCEKVEDTARVTPLVVVP